jgi:hypothetical protein
MRCWVLVSRAHACTMHAAHACSSGPAAS